MVGSVDGGRRVTVPAHQVASQIEHVRHAFVQRAAMPDQDERARARLPLLRRPEETGYDTAVDVHVESPLGDAHLDPRSTDPLHDDEP